MVDLMYIKKNKLGPVIVEYSKLYEKGDHYVTLVKNYLK